MCVGGRAQVPYDSVLAKRGILDTDTDTHRGRRPHGGEGWVGGCKSRNASSQQPPAPGEARDIPPPSPYKGLRFQPPELQ